MNVTFHLQAGNMCGCDMVASVGADTITVDGTAYDLSTVPEGGIATPEGTHPFAGPITRRDGLLHVPLLWRYDAATAENHQPVPAPIMITAGPIPDPVLRKIVEKESNA